jgi:anti-anti-sigma factor
MCTVVGCLANPRADQLSRGNHVCWSYRSADAHRMFLTEYFTAGLRANERLLYLASAAQLQTALSFLSDAGLDIGALMGSGTFSVAEVTDAYLSQGALEPDIRLAGHAVLVQQALDQGFDGLRVCSEIAPLLAHGGVRDEWYEYELRADVLIARLPSVVVCACDVRQAERGVVGDLASVHSLQAGAAAPAPFRLHAGQGGLTLSGEVDASSADRFGRWLRGALGDLPEPVLDVAGLEFIDAAGMWALLDSAHTHPDGLLVRGTSPQFRRAWSVCGYDAIGSVHLN